MSLAQLGIKSPSPQIHASVNCLTSPNFAQPKGLMDARMVAARLPGLAMYGAPYSAPNFPGYLPYGHAAAAAVAAASDPASIYPAMGAGESADVWRAGMNQATATAAYYDPASMAAHFSYGYGPMGFNDGARRKNATRETTSTLKAWLNEHRKNPYPTKGEKIMLAIITKMTLTQVSTWFANARRRLKKENKMTWSPRNRCGEDGDEDDLLDDGIHSNHPSRSSTPTETGEHHRGTDGARFGGHTSCGESLSDECHDDSVVRSSGKADCGDSDRIKETNVGRQLVNRHQDNKSRPSHFVRHNIHPYAGQRTSPTTTPNQNLPSPIPGTQRPGIPYPMNPHHTDSRLMQGGHFNPAAAASLLAASRRHPLPPHVMAALSEQAQLHHYQQALQQLPMHQYISNERKASSTQSPSPTQPSASPNNVRTSSPKEPTSTKSPSTPTKSKIWSIAEVATSSDTSKCSKSPDSKSPPHPELTNNLSHVQSWMDNMLQQKLAAVMASAGNVHNGMGMTAQQIQHIASMHPHNSFVPPNGARTGPQFPTFPDLMAMQSYRHSESGSISPEAVSPQFARPVTSPTSSHHSETSNHELDAKKTT